MKTFFFELSGDFYFKRIRYISKGKTVDAAFDNLIDELNSNNSFTTSYILKSNGTGHLTSSSTYMPKEIHKDNVEWIEIDTERQVFSIYSR